MFICTPELKNIVRFVELRSVITTTYCEISVYWLDTQLSKIIDVVTCKSEYKAAAGNIYNVVVDVKFPNIDEVCQKLLLSFYFAFT
jgi:hypothetical protein